MQRGVAARLRAARPWRTERQPSSEPVQVLLGTVLSRLQNGPSVRRLRDVEFKVFSQFGDDGIVQFLTQSFGGHRDHETFVEFGVEDYSESNTRFLLMKDNWRGLVLDGDPRNVEAIRANDYFWRHDLTAVSAFIDRQNINALIADHGFVGDIGLLSIDIDGNDYWVWEVLTVVDPLVVIVEYNSVFGAERAVSVPYNPSFRRFDAHHSGLYWGCSLPALLRLAEAKGYEFLGCNSAGNNAYFARPQVASGLERPALADGYVESRFREARNVQGDLTFVGGRERLALMKGLPLVDVESGATIRVDDLLDR